MQVSVQKLPSHPPHPPHPPQWCEAQPQCQRKKLRELLDLPWDRLSKYKLLLLAVAKRTADPYDKSRLEHHVSRVEWNGGCCFWNGDTGMGTLEWVFCNCVCFIFVMGTLEWSNLLFGIGSFSLYIIRHKAVYISTSRKVITRTTSPLPSPPLPPPPLPHRPQKWMSLSSR